MRCELTDLPADMCAHCLGHTDPELQAAKDRVRLLASGWIAAEWPGYCGHCGEWFDAGTAIRMDFIPRAECCADKTS